MSNSPSELIKLVLQKALNVCLLFINDKQVKIEPQYFPLYFALNRIYDTIIIKRSSSIVSTFGQFVDRYSPIPKLLVFNILKDI